MLVVSLALAAVLLAGGDGDSERSNAAIPEVTALVATPTLTPKPATTPGPVPDSPLPFSLRERVNTLPEKLQNETMYAYVTGSLSLEQLEQIVTDYENRNPAVRVGSVLGIEGSSLRFEVFTTGEAAAVSTGAQTSIRRGGEEIALADLRPEELVMVVSTEGGTVALTIEAFGVAAL